MAFNLFESSTGMAIHAKHFLYRVVYEFYFDVQHANQVL